MFIDLWWLPLCPGPATIPDPEQVLSAEERRRAARFRFPEHATRFLVCHAALRRILGQYLGQPPESLEFVAPESGKPRLAGDSTLSFNLSHSRDAALIAVAPGLEVGVDVEAIRPDFAVDDVARLFTSHERELLGRMDTPGARALMFYRLWTRKEAVLKAEGSGLGGLEHLDISGSPPEPARFPADGERWWRVEDLEVECGYAAALAAPAGEWKIRWRAM
jgi:4'-phosphopantetheinyl transferase